MSELSTSGRSWTANQVRAEFSGPQKLWYLHRNSMYRRFGLLPPHCACLSSQLGYGKVVRRCSQAPGKTSVGSRTGRRSLNTG